MGPFAATAHSLLHVLSHIIGRIIGRRVDADLRLIRAKWGRVSHRLHKMGSISAAHASRLVHTGEPAIDDRVAADLDIGAVFRTIDRTTSTLGQRALFSRLHRHVSPESRAAVESLVSRFTVDVDARERAQLALLRLQDPSGYDLWRLGGEEAVRTQGWHVLFPALTLVSAGLALGAIVWHALWPLFVAALIAVVCVRVLVAEDVTNVGAALRHVAPLILTGESLAFLEEEATDALCGFRQDLNALARLKSVSRWLGGDPLLLAARAGTLTTLLSALTGVVSEYLNMVLLLDANSVYFAGADLRRHSLALRRVLERVGDIDTALSVAAWRAERSDWTRPVFAAPGAGLQAAQLRHPLVEPAVPNSLTLPSGQGALITGSNMSGKSTFLRTVGVNVVLAQSLNTVLASRYEAPVYMIKSCIGRSDDLLGGKSYYLAEVEAVLGLVRSAGAEAPHIFLFDELFRGTNAVERVAAAHAVLDAVVGDVAARHVALAATHDLELVDLTRGTYATYHLSDRLTLDGLVFDFRLQPGPATSRNAIALLEQHGAPRALVAQATATAAMLDAHRYHDSLS